jgi:hypothetical protein
LTKRAAKADPEMLAKLYLADTNVASAWHHSLLMSPRSQSIYGYVSKDGEDYSLSWSHKGPSILGAIGGISEIVAQRLQKEGSLESFMNKVSANSFVGARNFNHPQQV